jgi:DNA-binding PadR family transcriptional regulator
VTGKKSVEPTTTTYAILGLLAAGPASPYDLSIRLQIGYGFYWPRARSHVFTEAKKIAALGWASGAVLRTGRRKRTEYTITTQGRAALRAWLATEPVSFTMEFEHLVRVYLAGFGTTDDLLRVLDDAAERANQMLAIAERVIAGYEAGAVEGPQDEPHLRVLLVDYLANLAALTAQWAERSHQDVTRWSTDEAERRSSAVRRLTQLPRTPIGGPSLSSVTPPGAAAR